MRAAMQTQCCPRCGTQCTYIQTYLQTNTHPEMSSHQTLRARRKGEMMLTRSSEPTAIADTIGPIFTTIAEAGDRQTVSRIGERERLDAEIRLLVLIRDGFTCAWCESRIPHASGRALQVDHILPWSAGGSDSTTNLRTLCRTHNQQRSNFRTDLD